MSNCHFWGALVVIHRAIGNGAIIAGVIIVWGIVARIINVWAIIARAIIVCGAFSQEQCTVQLSPEQIIAIAIAAGVIVARLFYS